MLGHKLCQELPKYGHQVCGTLRSPLPPEVGRRLFDDGLRLISGVDVTRLKTVEDAVLRSEAEVIVNAIGLIKQRKEASRRASLVLLNAYFPHFLADLSLRSGKRLIHISTDCVFDGKQGMYKDFDATNPEEPYGQSKMLGETDQEETSAVTIRTSIIGREIGPGAYGLLEWFFSMSGKKVKGYTQAIYTGLTTLEISKAIHFALIKGRGLNGTIHVSSEKISKMDLLSAVNEAFNLGITIEPERLQGKCDRSLVMDRFSQVTGYHAPPWREMIAALKADPTNYDAIRLRMGG